MSIMRLNCGRNSWKFGEYEYGEGNLCASYWNLVLEKIYKKEGIQVPDKEETVEFTKYQFPKSVEDDSEVCLTIARIPDCMLKKVDQTNPALLNYLKTINLDVETGVLLAVDAGTSKQSK